MKKSITGSQLTIITKKGFSLVELLVVISIVGILATLVTITFNNIQDKSRDSKRKQDLKTIASALELAREDSPDGYYPACDGPPWNHAGSPPRPPTTPDWDYAQCDITNLHGMSLAPNYIKVIPKDPMTGFEYQYRSITCSANINRGCSNYHLWTDLENANDPQIAESHTFCGVGNPLTFVLCPKSYEGPGPI